MQKGSDILDAAKKTYGKYSKWRRMAEGNNMQDLLINNSRNIAKNLKVPK